ncbi:imidazolonepropionase-like amidohydrolase [Novosphingobium sp. PhB165]|uniref:amidohydrolase family protein n=1 Tax=Novosphingobium sp. PhB165 TaxID=2485105 RepID=UPI0010E3C33F|nr:amidohydrolase family protein [Novosphingobium sp. PhB165]TCM13981.1 imidazolonepropionase-like amidohydrolase [Novosphingobium sp. PhB165]
MSRRLPLWLGTLMAAAIGLGAPHAAGAQDALQPGGGGQTAIVAAGYVDVVSGEAVPNAVVLVQDGRIAAIGPADRVAIPGGAKRVDLPGKWLIPGLMNMHVHLGLILPGMQMAELAGENDAQLALRMADNAYRSLLSGVTTIRLTGDLHHADLALAQAINRGTQQGPRIISSGEIVTITGGHGTGLEPTNDGPDQIRMATRREIRAGAQWIKIAITGGIGTPGGGVAQGLMTPDEIQAAVEIASRSGVKVTAHSGSPNATREAVDLGVKCIEHGYFLDRPVLKLMHDRGVWLVPTMIVSQPATFEFFKRIGSPDWYMERVREVGKEHWKALQMAIQEHVNIAVGSDQFPFEPNDGTTATIREAEYYLEAGMTPLQALQAATIQPARMLGMENQIGSLTVGKFADIVAVDGNPLENFHTLRSLAFVMKGGRVYRNDWDANSVTLAPPPPRTQEEPARAYVDDPLF